MTIDGLTLSQLLDNNIFWFGFVIGILFCWVIK